MKVPPPRNTTHTALGPGGEFDMVRSIWDRIGERGGSSGDDCAFFQVGDARLAISSDLSIEGTHFRTGWIGAGEIGWRAATAALSDLAAVAASPVGLMVSLGLAREQPRDLAAEVMEGVAEAAAATGAIVWGGDIVQHDLLVIDVTVVGRLDGPPVERSGAAAGDALFVTGALGAPAAAIAAWQAGREPEATARGRFARPVARIREARWLRNRGARAMIDLSDGLMADAAHLGAASGVTCVLDWDGVPVHPGARDGGVERAVTSGEEFELLVALQDDQAISGDFSDEFDLPLTRVGVVRSGSDGEVGVRIQRNGETVSDLHPFRHF